MLTSISKCLARSLDQQNLSTGPCSTSYNQPASLLRPCGHGRRSSRCRPFAAATSADKSAASPSAPREDWSQRLLQVTKKRRTQADNPDDVFKAGVPRSSGFQDDDFDDDDDGAGTSAVPGEKRLPAEVRCFDTARIYIKSGDGGDGCVAFRREKFVEFGGPAGGNGGRGGNVWAEVDPGQSSLLRFRSKLHWRAAAGTSGQGSNMDGAVGEDLVIPVPLGTIIRRRDAPPDEAPLAELVKPGERALLLVGGRGGRGNSSFKTAFNKAPTIAERGEVGQEMWVDVELKVVADVGIVGVPNAGKSTLLSVVTDARPKIANYPFTTLVPNLGVCELDYRTTVFADVPGLLEGAHEGLGLGHEFLRHVQRCRTLVHVIDGTSPDPIGDWNAINLELELFNPQLKDKPQIVAYNKMDVPESSDYWELVRDHLLESGLPPDRLFPISAVTGRGVMDLVRRVRALMDELGPVQELYATNAVNATTVPRGRTADVRIDDYRIDVQEDGATCYYVVQGEALERFAQMTNWDYYEAVRRFQRVLDVAGINASLRAKGIKEGDTVVIGESEFNWSDDQSEGAMYGSWLEDMKNRGRSRVGSSKWPRSSPN